LPKKIEPVSIIIPTFNAPDMLGQCVNSIGITRLSHPLEIIIVNNGHPRSLDSLGSQDFFKIIQTGGRNLGWEGGLIEGLKHTKSEFVMFMNDDTFIPIAQAHWLQRMAETFHNLSVAAVGPSTNVVMGQQNMTYRSPHMALEVSYLIGFCMLLKRKCLDEVGGVDDTLPGGDDLDLSIRLRKAGKLLIARRDVYIHHHGFQTGTRLYGGPTSTNGWNSRNRTERTNMALIKKHGFAEWYRCIAGLSHPGLTKGADHEGGIIRQYIVGDKVVDLGCANNKTIPTAIGLDIIPKGKIIPFLNAESEGDMVANVENDLPLPDESQDTIIARHILEHCLDTVGVMSQWKAKLKHGGRLIIALPNEDLMNTIPLNGEHVHAFNPVSLNRLGELLGLKRVGLESSNEGSFITVFERNGI
jgi:GT2 family glycosyltransferase